ncbi:TPA: hypothetical protein ACX6RS_000340 [Photobacterium damselae]
MFEGIEVCTTWECVNSFSSWLSAILSPIIAFVSLYISFKAYKYAKEKDKPKIYVSMNYTLIPERNSFLLALNVNNIGIRKVTINSYGWKYKIPFSLPISISTAHIPDRLSDSLPITIDEGQRAVFYNKYDVLSNDLFNAHYVIAGNSLKEHNLFVGWLAVKRMKIIINCTTFTYESSLPKPQKKEIWNTYLNERKYNNILRWLI